MGTPQRKYRAEQAINMDQEIQSPKTKFVPAD